MMKHNFWKIIFVLFFLVFNLSFSCSALTIGNPLPIITPTFSEPVIVDSIESYLKDSSNNSIYIEMVNSSDDNRTFQYQPVEYLDEGSYYFRIRAEDIYGNQGSFQIQPFTILVPSFSISLNSPYFGVSSENPFDITINTSLPGSCRYSYVPKDYEDMNSYLSSSDTFYHTLNNFNLGSVNTVYFACFSAYKNETASASFAFSFDDSIPQIISISADDVAEYPIESTLSVKTDNKTICAYHKDYDDFSNMNIFDGSSIYNINSYTKDHIQILDDEDLVDFSTNTFNIVCINLAGTMSSVKTISVSVSSESEAVVSVISPKDNSYQPAGSVLFNITTNKIAKCHFSDDEDSITESGGTFGTFTKKHEATLQLDSGDYTYYFQCLVNTPEGLLDAFSSDFTVDATPPEIVYADDSSVDNGLENLSEFTYNDDRLFLRFYALDNESGIELYNYSIWQDKSADFEEDVSVLNWTILESDESEGSILEEDLALKDTARYYFRIKAMNSAGMWSSEKLSDGITVNLALGNLGHCSNRIQDSTETDVDCGGLCSKCADTKSCSINGDCQSNYCDPSSKRCKSSSSCSNRIKDSTETDVDCGGSCSGCISGDSCIKNSDCQSNYCDPSTRLCLDSDTCINGATDPGETDTDCGGPCSPCLSGKKCNSDFDCQSAYCDSGICSSSSGCGNGEFDEGEQCDSSTELSCALFGLEPGILSCSNQCNLDTSQCLGQDGICGDGIINPGEQCDGSNLNNIKCYDIKGYQSGTLSCGTDCILVMNKCSVKLNPLQDTDNDGMADSCELKYFNCRTCANPEDDKDNDKLTNKEECLLCSREGSNPEKEDTDNDGYSDYAETKKGTSPCDSSDYPKMGLWWVIPLIIIIIIAGLLFYLRKKGSILFKKEPPFISLREGIESVKDLFNPPALLKKEINKEYYKPAYSKEVKSDAGNLNIEKKNAVARKKSSSLRKIMKEKQRKSAFESFSRDGSNSLIKKLPETEKTNKPDTDKEKNSEIASEEEKDKEKEVFSDLPSSKSKKRIFDDDNQVNKEHER